MSNHIDRRKLLGIGAVIGGGALALVGCGRGAEDQGQAPASNKAEDEAHDAELFNQGILLEQGAINVYTAAAGLPFIASDAAVLGVAKLFMGQHEEHRDTLAKWIQTMGGTPVDPKTAQTPDIPAAITDDSLEEAVRKQAVLEFARKLEKQAAGTYFELVTQLLHTDFARRSAAEILPVEAQHVAVYDLVLKKAMPVSAALFSEQS